MRQIDKDMLQAVCEHGNWHCDNTQVTNNGNVVRVFLHGNLIYEDDGEQESFTLAGWDTLTTRNRLRALGANIFHKNGKIYASKCSSGANAIEINKNDWYNF